MDGANTLPVPSVAGYQCATQPLPPRFLEVPSSSSSRAGHLANPLNSKSDQRTCLGTTLVLDPFSS